MCVGYLSCNMGKQYSRMSSVKSLLQATARLLHCAVKATESGRAGQTHNTWPQSFWCFLKGGNPPESMRKTWKIDLKKGELPGKTAFELKASSFWIKSTVFLGKKGVVQKDQKATQRSLMVRWDIKRIVDHHRCLHHGQMAVCPTQCWKPHAVPWPREVEIVLMSAQAERRTEGWTKPSMQ